MLLRKHKEEKIHLSVYFKIESYESYYCVCSQLAVESMESGVRQSCVGILALPLAGHAILGQSVTLPELRFPLSIRCPPPQVVVRIK